MDFLVFASYDLIGTNYTNVWTVSKPFGSTYVVRIRYISDTYKNITGQLNNNCTVVFFSTRITQYRIDAPATNTPVHDRAGVVDDVHLGLDPPASSHPRADT